MDLAFLEELGLDEGQQKKLLSHVKQQQINACLKAEKVRSVEAANGILASCDANMTAEAAVAYLKEEHPYLFEGGDPIFSGPVGGTEQDKDEQALRKALGLD